MYSCDFCTRSHVPATLTRNTVISVNTWSEEHFGIYVNSRYDKHYYGVSRLQNLIWKEIKGHAEKISPSREFSIVIQWTWQDSWTNTANFFVGWMTVRNVHKEFGRIRRQARWCWELYSAFDVYMAHCSRWYTPDTHASSDDISASAPHHHHHHPRRTKACIPS